MQSPRRQAIRMDQAAAGWTSWRVRVRPVWELPVRGAVRDTRSRLGQRVRFSAPDPCPATTLAPPLKQIHAGVFSMERALHPSTLTGLDDPGPALTPAEAVAVHDRPEGVAWFAIPTPDGAGVIARAHTEAHDGGRLLPGHLTARDLAELHTVMPPGLTFDPALGVGSPPGCLGWWWANRERSWADC